VNGLQRARPGSTVNPQPAETAAKAEPAAKPEMAANPTPGQTEIKSSAPSSPAKTNNNPDRN
jgi:hypothetical protein